MKKYKLFIIVISFIFIFLNDSNAKNSKKIDKISKNFIKETITQFHSYVPSTVSVGRRIDWVVFNDDKPIGMIGIGSSVYPPPKDILTHIKMTKNEYIFSHLLSLLTYFK